MNTSPESNDKTPKASHEKPKMSDKELDALVTDRQLKKLRESTAKIISIKGWLITSGISLAIVSYIAFLVFDSSYFQKVWFYLALGGSALVVGGVLIGYVKMLFRIQSRQLERQLVVSETTRLQQELEQDFFNNLVKINFKYIDKYYLQTQVQADRSFYLSAFASLFAFGVIVSGVVMLYRDKVQQGYVVAASGILGEFIASVFFYLYNRTVSKMGEYHQKLVLTQNISLALKIANDLPPEQQVDVKKKLIEDLSKDINRYLTSSPVEAKSSLSNLLENKSETT